MGAFSEIRGTDCESLGRQRPTEADVLGKRSGHTLSAGSGSVGRILLICSTVSSMKMSLMERLGGDAENSQRGLSTSHRQEVLLPAQVA